MQAPISDITNLKRSSLTEGEMLIESGDMSEQFSNFCKEILLKYPYMKKIVVLERPKRQE